MKRSSVGLRAGSVIVSKEKKEYRMEHDSVGDKKVPAEAYYGVQTLRAAENFPITGLNIHPELISSVAYIKKGAESLWSAA